MNAPITYEIVIRGLLSKRLQGTLADDFTIEAANAGTTRLIGPVRDPAHLHGVVTNLTALAIEIVSLTPIEPVSHNQPTNHRKGNS